MTSKARAGWLESGERVRWWPTDRGELVAFVVPRPPKDYVIQHAGKLYPTLAEAEQAALGSYRIITYGPQRKESP